MKMISKMKITVALFSCCLFLGAQAAQDQDAANARPLTITQRIEQYKTSVGGAQRRDPAQRQVTGIKMGEFNFDKFGGRKQRRRRKSATGSSINGKANEKAKGKPKGNPTLVRKGGANGLSWTFRQGDVTTLEEGMKNLIASNKFHGNIKEKSLKCRKGGLILLTGAHHYLLGPLRLRRKMSRGGVSKIMRIPLSGVSHPPNTRSKKPQYFTPSLSRFPTVTQLIEDIKETLKMPECYARGERAQVEIDTDFKEIKKGTKVQVQKVLDNNRVLVRAILPKSKFGPERNMSTSDLKLVHTPVEFLGKSYDVEVVSQYLRSLTEYPDTTRIGCLRQVRRIDQTYPNFAKPAWAAEIIKRLNRRKDASVIKYVLDFGTQKVALTNPDGRQNDDFYAEYKKKTTTDVVLKKGIYDPSKNDGKTTSMPMKDYFENLGKFLETSGISWKNVAARFTGDFRSLDFCKGLTARVETDAYSQYKVKKGTKVLIENVRGGSIDAEVIGSRHSMTFNRKDLVVLLEEDHVQKKKDTYFDLVRAKQMNFGCLNINDEATCGSQHTLDIATPYIQRYNAECKKYDNLPIQEVLILESGSGSIQGVKYKLVPPPKKSKVSTAAGKKRRRLKSPFGIEVLENLLDECREAGYPN